MARQPRKRIIDVRTTAASGQLPGTGPGIRGFPPARCSRVLSGPASQPMAQRHQHALPCPQKAIMTAVTPRRSGRRRAAGAALAAAAWAAIWAAALAGGHLGRGGTAQIAFAAIMATCAMGETLFPPGAAGRYGRLGIVAFTSCCVLVLAVGSAALG